MSVPLADCAVIVTVKDDAPALARLLRALESQTLLPSTVCLVVAQSADATAEVASQWLPQGIEVQVLDVSSTTTRSEARNRGVASTSASILVFTDAGCLPEPHWLEALLEPFTRGEVLVSGLTLPEITSPWDEAQARFVLVSPSEIEQHPLPATRNMALTREVWDLSNGFDPKLNFAEDFAFARTLRDAGILAVFAPDAIVYWKPRETMGAFFSMILRLTAGDVLARIVRPGLMSMWIRYAVFGTITIFLVGFTGVFRALIGLLVMLVFYSLLKQRRWKDLSSEARVWAVIFQFVSDAAVLSGTMLGLAWRQRSGENRGT